MEERMANLCEELRFYFDAFDELRAELAQALEGWDTPIVVVFGPQNAGKSTLLERLAMLPIFPKGEGLCTRVPIRIRLRTGTKQATLKVLSISENGETILDTKVIEDDIQLVLHQMMNSLLSDLDSNERGIRSDRLIEVELWSEKYPNIDLLDLPGLVLTPNQGDAPDLPDQTYQLVLDTIDQTKGRAIFLAVREAGYDIQQSLTTKVLRDRPEIKDRSLGVLTKCDKYADSHILHQLESTTQWALGYGYVATMNKPLNGNERDLVALSETERVWFSKNEERQHMLNNNQAGCDELIDKLSNIYHQYLKDSWAPSTMCQLAFKICERETQIVQLGLPEIVEDQLTEQHLAKIERAITGALRGVRDKIILESESLIRNVPLWNESESSFPQQLKISYSVGSAKVPRSDFLRVGFDPKFGLIPQLKDTFLEIISSLPQLISDTISEAFINDQSEVRLGRFPNLRALLLDRFDPEATLESLQNILSKYAHHFLHERLSYEDKFVYIKEYQRLKNILITALLFELSDVTSQLEVRDLSEHPASLFFDQRADERADLRHKIGKIEEAQLEFAELFELEIPTSTSQLTVCFQPITVGDALSWGVSKVSTPFREVCRSLGSVDDSLLIVDKQAPFFRINFSDAVILRGYTLRFVSAQGKGKERRSWKIECVTIAGETLLIEKKFDRRKTVKVSLSDSTVPIVGIMITPTSPQEDIDSPLEVELELMSSRSLLASNLMGEEEGKAASGSEFQIDENQAVRKFTRYLANGVEFQMNRIPNRSFVIAETQVTQELYEAVMGRNPSTFKGPQRPVEQVSWEDAIAFCNALSNLLKLTPVYQGTNNNAEMDKSADGFRLPSEAEWEWAARGGQNFAYAGSKKLDEVGWYDGNSRRQTHPVGQKKANGYGLFDMSGNVWEWTNDDYNNPGEYRPGAGYRAFRGGGWSDGGAGICIVSSRGNRSPDDRRRFLGFRFARSIVF